MTPEEFAARFTAVPTTGPLDATDPSPIVVEFFEKVTSTGTYVVIDPLTRHCAIIDSVLDFEINHGNIATKSADALVAFIAQHALQPPSYILETHVHADHLTAAHYLQGKFPNAKVVISTNIITVQKTFFAMLDITNEPADGSHFDLLVSCDADRLPNPKDQATAAPPTLPKAQLYIGDLPVYVIHTPGHTPACATYIIGWGKQPAAFCGDTLFMPDVGSARCDFPGGSATALYQSIQHIFDALPSDAVIYVGHDYPPATRSNRLHTTVQESTQSNKHVKAGTTIDEFVQFRSTRDKELKPPLLIYPALQVNLLAGRLPKPAINGTSFFKIPLRWI